MSDTQTFESFVTNERARIAKAREGLIAQRMKIDGELAAFDKELTAIAAYENVKSGRSSTPRPTSTGTGTRRTGQRENILSIIKASPSGISASDVIAKAGASSDADKTSVRNALGALKRNNLVDLKGGNYVSK